MTPENPETNTRNIEAAAKLKVVQQDDPSSGQQRYLRFDQLKWVGDRVNPRATRFVLITVALQLLGLVISAIFKLGPDSAGAITLAILTAFIVFCPPPKKSTAARPDFVFHPCGNSRPMGRSLGCGYRRSVGLSG